MAPLKCTIPEMLATAALEVLNGALVQPLWSVSGVNVAACAAVAPASPRGSINPRAHNAPAAIRRSLFIPLPPEHSPCGDSVARAGGAGLESRATRGGPAAHRRPSCGPLP